MAITARWGANIYKRNHMASRLFCLYRAILENKENASAWNGLILALTFMRKEYDVQTVLARFALQPQLPYDPDMISFAMMMWQNNPRALGEWMAAVSRMRGTGEHKAMLTGLEADLKKAYGDLVEQHGEETLQEKRHDPACGICRQTD